MLFLPLFHKCKNTVMKTIYIYRYIDIDISLGYFIDEVLVGLTSTAEHTLIFLIVGNVA